MNRAARSPGAGFPTVRRGRGFTLLETMLAALIGSLVLGVCMTMFAFLDRSDRRMGARFEQAMGLERLRRAVDRAMSTLVMSSEPPRRGGENRTVGGTPAGAAPEADPRPLPPPRFLIEPDGSPTVERLVKRARIAGMGATTGITTPQRMEVVLERSPIPTPRASAPEHGRRAVRGVFELRPDSMTPATAAGIMVSPSYRVSGAAEGWTLWWRPLPTPAESDPSGPSRSKSEADVRGLDPTQDPAAVPIMSGLTDCTWTVYRKREKRRDLNAIWSLDLPAYVELSVTTTAGLTSQWMFEVGWISAPEVVEEPPTPVPGESSVRSEGGATTRGGIGGATTTEAPRRITPGGSRSTGGGK
jgi:hypothetical protein